MVIERERRSTKMWDLKDWLDERFTVQRDQAPIAQDSGAGQSAVEPDALPEAMGESPPSPEGTWPTDLEPMSDQLEPYAVTRSRRLSKPSSQFT